MFNAPSLYTEFERALGQYILYRTLMAVVYPNHELFLGVPEDIQADFFKREAVRLTLTAQRINVLVFNPEQEERLDSLKCDESCSNTLLMKMFSESPPVFEVDLIFQHHWVMVAGGGMFPS